MTKISEGWQPLKVITEFIDMHTMDKKVGAEFVLNNMNGMYLDVKVDMRTGMASIRTKEHEFDGVKFTGKITGYGQVLSFLSEIDEFDVSKKAWASIESAKEYLRGVE